VLVGLLGSIYPHTTEQDLKDDGKCVRLMLSLGRFMDNLHVLVDGHSLYYLSMPPSHYPLSSGRILTSPHSVIEFTTTQCYSSSFA
jgi:hypothetical protein